MKLHQPGLPDEVMQEVTNQAFQLRSRGPIQLTPLFISYSRADGEFVDAVVERLRKAGIRFWRDVDHSTSGPLEAQIHHQIAERTVLLVLSEDSVRSAWVEHEVDYAHEVAGTSKRHMLCPIALDASWKDCGWSGPVMTQLKKYNVLDFSRWQEPSVIDDMFHRLVKGLGIYYLNGPRPAE